MKRYSRQFACVMVLVIGLTGCSSVKSSTEYKSLEKSVNDLEIDISKLQATIDSVTLLKSELADLKLERSNIQNEIARIGLKPSVLGKVKSQLLAPACVAYQEKALKLLAQRDDEGSEAYWEAISAGFSPEIERWFFRVPDESQTPKINVFYKALNWDDCSNAALQTTLLKKCVSFDRKLLKRNPDEFKGKCLKGTVKIQQADSNTGPCAFQGYVGGGYEVRAQFGTTLDAKTHSSATDCTKRAKRLTEGATVRFMAISIGSYSYDTTSGGAQTVPAFKIFLVY